ncbi:hypothetical protein [Paenibacillus tengchongensis]|uniref:hypothetical protein n=1 Tax=Paenibacillus tengchongensis TaxID=2608684 RepID=UPI00124DF016|nr:hypothetical protein [Paenibacillus tengchongensis]
MSRSVISGRKSSFIVLTGCFAAAAALTVLALITTGFTESLPRLIITMLSLLTAEGVLYGYSLYWLRSAATGRVLKPVLVSGAFIAGTYAIAVLASALLLGRLLKLPPLWYALGQLLVLMLGAAALGAAGLYGRNAARNGGAADASRLHLRQREGLAEAAAAARTWKRPEASRLTELVAGLQESFQYSDPVSVPGLYATEELLDQQISLLQDHVKLLLALPEPPQDWEAESIEITQRIAVTLARRNRELAGLK